MWYDLDIFKDQALTPTSNTLSRIPTYSQPLLGGCHNIITAKCNCVRNTKPVVRYATTDNVGLMETIVFPL